MPRIEGHVRAQTQEDGAARLRGILRDEELVSVDGHDDVGAVLAKGSVHERRHDLVVTKLRPIVALDADGQSLFLQRAQDVPRAVTRRVIYHEHLIRIRQGVTHEALDDVGTVRDQGYGDDLVHVRPLSLDENAA